MAAAANDPANRYVRPPAGGRARRGGLYAGFLLTGTVTTLLGPLLPWLTVRWSLDDRSAGGFFLAQFLASVVGTWWASRRAGQGFQRTARGGYALIALGMAIVALAGAGQISDMAISWLTGPQLAYGAVAIYGLGLGLVIPALNLQTAERHGERAAAALNWLNFGWGLGAMASPLWVAAMLRMGRPAVGLAVLAVLAALAASFSVPADVAAAPAAEDRPNALPPHVVSTGGAVILFAFGVFVYVALENSVGGWAAMLGRAAGWAGVAAVVLPAAFWGGLLAGRAAAPRLLEHLAELRLALGGLVAAGAGLGIVAASHGWGLWLGMALAGLGLAAEFPLLIATMGRRLGSRAAASTLIFALGGLGGAAGPWLMGQIGAASGSLRTALVVPAVAVALLFVGWIVIGKRRSEPMQCVG